MPWEYVDEWRALPGVHPTRPDPYVIWAAVTGWTDYSGEPSKVRLAGVIVELNSEENFEEFLKVAPLDEVVVPRDYLGDKLPIKENFFTAGVTAVGLCMLADPTKLGHLVKRFDLCDFVQPGRSLTLPLINNQRKPSSKPPLRGTRLIGVIDNGCAFIHASFVVDGSTRIAALWDQDPKPAFEGVCESYRKCYGGEPYRFPVGREIWREDHRSRLGLDRWIKRFTPDVVDEANCYEDANYPSLRPKVVHGPHVMDILAGPLRLRQRIYTTRDDPPEWGPPRDDIAGDPARSDIVFVQLPRKGLRDSSGGWLDSRVLDAIRYILYCRGDDTDLTVINLSYGSTVGPHDGTSILDGALLRIKDRERQAVRIVMAAGNSRSSRAHARFVLGARRSGALTWSVPPGSEAPAFMQVWLTNSDVKVRVTPPGENAKSMGWLTVGEVATWKDGGVEPTATVAYLQDSSRGKGPMLLIAIAPTAQPAAASGPDENRAEAIHGDWVIDVESLSSSQMTIHAYIARNDMGLQSSRRGRQSYFVDAADEAEKYLRRAHVDIDAAVPDVDDDALLDPEPRRASFVRRRGTVNGIATPPYVDEGGADAVPTVHAAGGYQRNFSDPDSEPDFSRTSYSSGGLAGDPRGRFAIDTRMTDESRALLGVRAAGSIGTSTFRLVGTSSAAPQAARDAVNESPESPIAAPPRAAPRPAPPPPPPPCPNPEDYGTECPKEVERIPGEPATE